MIIRFKDYKGITIPNELLVSEGSFGSSTPYTARIAANLKKRTYREFRLPAKLTCLENLNEFMIGDYNSFADVMAGVGLSTRLFDKKGCKLFLNDNDESCRKVVDLNFKVKATDFDVMSSALPECDVSFLDFNNFTLARYEKEHMFPLSEAFKQTKKYVILNDCSIFYFRYGGGSFANYSKRLGINIYTIENYFKAIKIYYQKRYPNWFLIAAHYFRDSSFLLFSKIDQRVEIRRIDVGNLEAGLIQLDQES